MQVRCGSSTFERHEVEVGRSNKVGSLLYSIGELYVGHPDKCFDGHDRITVEDSSLKEVEGEFKNGRFVKGKLFYSNGDIWEGAVDRLLQWDDEGKLTRNGTEISEQIGQFQSGCFIKGTVLYRNGDVYQGASNGAGELIGAGNSFTLKGFFRGLDSCTGTLATHDAVYRGECLKNKAHGFGERKLSMGTVQFGTFFNGKFGSGEGYSCETYPDGSRYSGMIVNEKKHGNGILIYPNGNYYVGGFSKGELDGEGVLLAADGTIIKEGEWVNGNFEE